jgi:glucosyl-3-phosphoglycerate synthase
VQLRAQRWFRERTYSAAAFPLPELLAAKHGQRVSVVLPARDEAGTVGAIVRTVLAELVAPGLVDEVVVVDSHSSDATAAVAAEAGATVVAQREVLPEYGDRPGKGEALWKSLAVTSGDLVVFLDADLVGFDAAYVRGLLGPLLTDSGVDFVKGMYERPLAAGNDVSPTGGGRVTELVARPLLNAFWPDLAGVVQPLGGEYAGRREVLERVPFVSGYGVEIGLLIDLLDAVGLDRLAQVDLGRRVHRHQGEEALGRMAHQIQLAAFRRLERVGRLAGPAPDPSLVQFGRVDGRFARREEQVDVFERPPFEGLARRRALGERPRTVSA